ncbi:Hypothetical protein BHO_0013200 (plasmid) [Borrelia hermsii YBT]|uniref:Uncharacterized protein n=1 Tax=Borrelia hermsii YBT TaxID=1313295 RepID=W5T7K9_BORHE|nr:Hypothetical protein BHO_0013200 [Borrelia hermsii YBT]
MKQSAVFLMNNILDRIHEDYKEIFLGNLEKRVVDKNPQVCC